MLNLFNFKNLRLRVLLIFIFFASILFTMDWVFKHLFFDPVAVDWQNNGFYIEGTETNYGVVGIRSVAHDNSTIFSALKFSMPDWAHFLMNFSIVAIFATIPFFTKSIFLAIAAGIIFSGVLGNSLDKVFSTTSPYYELFNNKSYVRDVFYLPWFDRGTFNFADVTIISGSILLIIYVIFSNVKDWKKTKAKKNQANQKTID